MARPTEPAIPTLREAIENGLISKGDIIASAGTFNQIMNRSSFNAVNALVLTKIFYGNDEVLNLLTKIDPAILDELLIKYNPQVATTVQIGSFPVLLQHHEIFPEITAIFGCMNTYPTQFNAPRGQLNPGNYYRFSKNLKEEHPNTWKGFLKVIMSDKDRLAEMVSRQGPQSGFFEGAPPPQRGMQMPTVIEMDSNVPFQFREMAISEEEPLFEVPQRPQQAVFSMDDVKPKSRVVSEEEWEHTGPKLGSDESSEEEPGESPVEGQTFKTRLRADQEIDSRVFEFEKHLHERNLSKEEVEVFKATIEALNKNLEDYLLGEYANEWQDTAVIEAFDVFDNHGGILNSGVILTTNLDYVENRLIAVANWIKKNYRRIMKEIKEYLQKGTDIFYWSEFHRQFYLRYMKNRPF